MSPDAPSPGQLLPVVVLLPLVVAGAVAVGLRAGGRQFPALVTGTVALTLLGVCALTPAVLATGRVSWSLSAAPGGFELLADAFSIVFALFGAFVWLCATLHATAYLREDPHRVRFHIVSLVVLSAQLGVVLAGNLATLFVCFELLGLIALLLVVHDGTERARRAAVKYFWMTLGGGFALLAGIFLVQAMAGTGAIAPLPADAGPPAMVWGAFVLLLIGFGVKAGMMPLHVWLPDAHPVAPAPASALLSGVMIKAGAYGIFRTLDMLFRPQAATGLALPDWDRAAQPGLLVLWLGVATMLIGVLIALGQRQAKRLLAWSSVSQIGFVLAGLGAGAWLGPAGAMGTAGGLLHAVNHALFKACLFLGIGAVARSAGTAELDRLGGLWRRMPVTFACTLIAAAGIAGLPLFNGFVSKSMIHHALVAGADRDGGAMLVAAEWLFLAASIGTAALLVRLVYLVFIRTPPRPSSGPVPEAAPPMLAAMVLLSVPVLLLGLRPHWILNGLIVPGIESWSMSAAPVHHYLEDYFLARADVITGLALFAAGLVVHALGSRLGLFRAVLPAWFGVDHWYRRAGTGFVSLCEAAADRAIRGHTAAIRVLTSAAAMLHRNLPRLSLTPLRRYWAWLAPMERVLALGPRLRGLVAAPLLVDRGDRAIRNACYRRLDELRSGIVRDAVDEARARSRHAGESGTPGAERKLNAAHLLAGLLGTRLLRRTMAAVAEASDTHAVEIEIARAEAQRQLIAREAAELAETWMSAAPPGATLADIVETTAGEPGPRTTPPDGAGWPAELGELVGRPASAHWPATEYAGEAALASALRRRLTRLERDPGVGLAIVFAALLILLVALYGGVPGG